MRFCPYCSGENDDHAVECQRCGHRLLPLPPSRTGSQGAQSPTVSLRPAGPGDGAASSAPAATGPAGGELQAARPRLRRCPDRAR